MGLVLTSEWEVGSCLDIKKEDAADDNLSGKSSGIITPFDSDGHFQSSAFERL